MVQTNYQIKVHVDIIWLVLFGLSYFLFTEELSRFL